MKKKISQILKFIFLFLISQQKLMPTVIDFSDSSIENHGDLYLSTESKITISGELNPLKHSIVLGNNLNIPDNVEVTITTSGIIDGQGHTLTLGSGAQLVVDGNVTLTLKNIILKSIYNSESNQAIKMIDLSSKLSLDNTILALNNDLYLETGQLFVHNDVVFTGTSKFIYKSDQPSYVAPHSRIIFDTETIFDYAPNSMNKDLFVLQNNTSELFLNGCTLQCTQTGLRLTKGRLFFDNKVTLSTYTNATKRLVSSSYTFTHKINYITNNPSIFSPDERYLATSEILGNLKVYSIEELKNNSPTPNSIFNQTVLNSTYSLDWSPDNKYVALGNGSDKLIIYAMTNLYGNPTTPTPFFSQRIGSSYIQKLSWSPNNRYIALARGNGHLTIFAISDLAGNPTSPTPIFDQNLSKVGGPIYSVNWDRTSKYVAIGTYDGLFKIYEFETLKGSGPYTDIHSQKFSSAVTNVQWSRDGTYLGISLLFNQNLKVYDLQTLLGVSPYTPKFDQNIISEEKGSENINAISWGKEDQFLTIGTSARWGTSYIKTYTFQPLLSNPPNPIPMMNISTNASIYNLNWSNNSNYIEVTDQNGQLIILQNNYVDENSGQTIENSIVFGNSSKGSDYDLNTFVLSGANIEINGLVFFDDAN